MNDYNVIEALYLNYEIHGPLVRVPGFRLGPILLYRKMYKIKYFFCTFTVKGDKINTFIIIIII